MLAPSKNWGKEISRAFTDSCSKSKTPTTGYHLITLALARSNAQTLFLILKRKYEWVQVFKNLQN